MSSFNPDFDDEFDEDDRGPGEEDFCDVLSCDECGKEFDVEFGDTPESCPFCGAEFA